MNGRLRGRLSNIDDDGFVPVDCGEKLDDPYVVAVVERLVFEQASRTNHGSEFSFLQPRANCVGQRL